MHKERHPNQQKKKKKYVQQTKRNHGVKMKVLVKQQGSA